MRSSDCWRTLSASKCHQSGGNGGKDKQASHGVSSIVSYCREYKVSKDNLQIIIILQQIELHPPIGKSTRPVIHAASSCVH